MPVIWAPSNPLFENEECFFMKLPLKSLLKVLAMEILYSGLCTCPALPLIMKKKKTLSKECTFCSRGNFARVCNHKRGF